MHKNNKHKKGYNFKELIQIHPALEPFVFENPHGSTTVNFADPQAVKALNIALLKAYYNIEYWTFPDAHLCPPIPGRVDYIHHLNQLLKPYTLKTPIHVLDVGVGATCIYPLLGHSVYQWHFVGTDIDPKAMSYAQTIIDKNGFSESIELRLQAEKSQILKGVIKSSDAFVLSLCNPPFYRSEQEALEATQRKMKGLGNAAPIRNFSGTANELWYEGGEKAFLHNYLYESSLYKTQCFWFTSLVSKKDLVKSMQKSFQKLGATQVKIIPMQLGNKVSRIVAWTFLTEAEQNDFIVVNS
ncbi:23S rRNA (adenine(1618)-N(6))-methyltransferase RlmF [Lacinutrix iliipiscaria]|uniref:Ribosomal RNA large subunit methyltransferase F n=1 Tax=Lacinutrix iliipiscaria TaxID=1230532 RepID=A0ABW5WNJ1_9FLAO